MGRQLSSLRSAATTTSSSPLCTLLKSNGLFADGTLQIPVHGVLNKVYWHCTHYSSLSPSLQYFCQLTINSSTMIFHGHQLTMNSSTMIFHGHLLTIDLFNWWSFSSLKFSPMYLFSLYLTIEQCFSLFHSWIQCPTFITLFQANNWCWWGVGGRRGVVMLGVGLEGGCMGW